MQALHLHWAISFDLHVLGMPPAFILSQDQTLQKNIFFWVIFYLLLKNRRFAQFSKNIFSWPFFQKTLNTITVFLSKVKNFFYFFSKVFLTPLNCFFALLFSFKAHLILYQKDFKKSIINFNFFDFFIWPWKEIHQINPSFSQVHIKYTKSVFFCQPFL